MEKNKIVDTIKSNWIARNLFWGIVFVVGLLLVSQVALRVMTQHDIRVKVPDFQGKQLSQAEKMASHSGVRLQVVDSIFNSRMARGAVFSQNPAAGGKVKRGRTIYLTINAVNERLVPMPDVVGYSFRQAKAEVLAAGLTIGKLIYKQDMATNNVLAQKSAKGADLAPGTMVPAGMPVDLELGMNYSDAYTVVPDLTGLTYPVAVSLLKDSYLNVQKLNFDSTVSSYADSLSAVVFRQSPEASENRVRMGREVKVYLTKDTKKLPAPKPATETPQPQQ